MSIGIGIDTGGTYTDAVIFDFERNAVLGSAKSPTTREDLSVGILAALDGLPAQLVQKAEMISLSTTLATNACVEEKGGRAKLIFFGGDARVIDQYGGAYGLPPSKDILLQESHTGFSGTIERDPDWELFQSRLKDACEDMDGVGILEMNAMRNGAVVERKAKALFQEACALPVVCGHELFSELNCLQRGASTLLNAALFPVIREFLEAIKRALAARGIRATLAIVRSDGSLMSEAFAAAHPVETLLCGPAASALGGMRLAGSPDSIIVDMGGTTTDIALVRDGRPVTVLDGVSVGKWKTFVDGLYIKTFGLGGDTAIHYNDKALFLEDYRVVPLCVAARKHPSILDSLKALDAEKRKHTKFLYEHYMLVRDIGDSPRFSPEERAFCRALRERPLILTEAAQAVGTDIYNLKVQRLVKEGVVQLCGLTPTDVMHMKGDFTGHCTEASRLAAGFAAHNLDISVEEFCDRVYDAVKRKLYRNVVKVLLENKHKRYLQNGVGPEVEAFVDESYEAAKAVERDPLISAMLVTDFALVGIGAPIRTFLPDVARMLGAKAVIPEHYQVANALGAIVGNIDAVNVVEIRPLNSAGGTSGFAVYGNHETRVFEELEDAEAFALEDAEAAARNEALHRGARGDIAVQCAVERSDAEIRDGSIYLGTMVTARAVGAVGFEA